jgi:hypothetical protein
MAISNEQVIEFVKRNPIGVACGVISIGLIATYYVRSGKLAEAESILETTTTESLRHEKNLEYAGGEGLKQDYDNLVAANKAIEGRLIRTGFGINYGYFQKIAADTGTKSVSLNQAAAGAAARAIPRGGFVPVAFNFVVQGTYGQILDVLYRLENGQHFCRVLNAGISKQSGAGSDTLTLTLSLELLGIQQ